MNLHLIACFHTVLNSEYTHCAFSQKCFRFAKMMHLVPGYRVIEYANEGSESLADEKVIMLSRQEFEQFYPKQTAKDFHGSYATIGERGWPTFNARLVDALKERVKPGDIICHPFGRSHANVVKLFPHVPHVETGIGYPDKPFGAWRIFESETWRHYHWGRDDPDGTLRNDHGMSRLYSWVIPNYFDLDDWPVCPEEENEDYVLFMGRIDPCKGTPTIAEVMRANAAMQQDGAAKALRFVIAGQGDYDRFIYREAIREPNPFIGKVPWDCEYRGPVMGGDRARLVGRARCMLMPTSFVEPFGGSGVEAMLTGTPLVSVNYGAFVETVQHGKNGFRCNVLGDWLAAIDECRNLDRAVVARTARERFSLQTCARLYDEAFQQVNGLNLAGRDWYTQHSYRVHPVIVQPPDVVQPGPSAVPPLCQ